jgi:hypothetical protein
MRGIGWLLDPFGRISDELTCSKQIVRMKMKRTKRVGAARCAGRLQETGSAGHFVTHIVSACGSHTRPTYGGRETVVGPPIGSASAAIGNLLLHLYVYGSSIPAIRAICNAVHCPTAPLMELAGFLHSTLSRPCPLERQVDPSVISVVTCPLCARSGRFNWWAYHNIRARIHRFESLVFCLLTMAEN